MPLRIIPAQANQKTGADALVISRAGAQGLQVAGEDTFLREWNGNTYQADTGERVSVISSKWVNYLDSEGSWSPIDCTLIPVSDGFEVSDAPFYFKAPLFADEEASFEANCRYDINLRTVINDDPFTMTLSCPSAEHVEGVIFDMSGDGSCDAILYEDAFPEWNADLIYYVKHGRAPRLEKLIRFRSDPGMTEDKTVDFHLDYSSPEEARGDMDDNEIPIANINAINAAMEKAATESSKKTKKGDIAARGEVIKARDLRRKPIGADIQTTKSIAVRPNGNKKGMRGVGFKDFYIWDSGEGKDQKKESITIDYKKVSGQRVLTKNIPHNFFSDAVYPVYTDTTSTFYPDPDTESTSVDGWVEGNGNASWDTAHDETTGFGSSDSASTMNARCYLSGGNYTFDRAFLLFDTSALPDGDSISSATLSIYPTTLVDNDNDAQAYNALVASTPASNTSLSAADINQCGDTDDPTKFSDDVDITGMSTGSYDAFTLNAAGLAAISKTGITKFGMRAGHDIEDDPITAINTVVFSSADESGTSQDPKLVIIHAAPPADPTGAACAAADNSQTLTVTWTDNASVEDEYYIERSDNGSTGWAEIGGAQAADSESYADNVGAWSTIKYYRVRCLDTDTGLYSGYTDVVSATTAPQAPTIGTAVAADGTTSLTLTWTDNSSDETTFSIEDSSDGSTGWAVVTTDTASPYVHAIGTHDTTKYYRVRAFRSGDSIYSGYSSVSAVAITSPAAPSSTAVIMSSTILATLTWTDNSSSESTFSIERKRTSGGTYAQVTTDTASPYEDVGPFDIDIAYYWRIRAYRASDGIYSSYDSEVNASFIQPPSNPQVVCTVANSTSSKALLTWQIDSTVETGFLIERSLNDSDWTTVTTTAAGIAEYEDTGLTEGTLYYYRVTTVGTNGNSSPTSSVSLTISRSTAHSLMAAFDKKINHSPR